MNDYIQAERKKIGEVLKKLIEENPSAYSVLQIIYWFAKYGSDKAEFQNKKKGLYYDEIPFSIQLDISSREVLEKIQSFINEAESKFIEKELDGKIDILRPGDLN